MSKNANDVPFPVIDESLGEKLYPLNTEPVVINFNGNTRSSQSNFCPIKICMPDKRTFMKKR
ncbi:MAG: hypothetical protein JWR09_2167 [Mucilaginibacter sp.]|nr:hypothetical protein [Mucilaginibacter sp.]